MSLPIGCAARYNEIQRLANELRETFINGNRKYMVETLEQMGTRPALAVLSTILVFAPKHVQRDLERFLVEVA